MKRLLLTFVAAVISLLLVAGVAAADDSFEVAGGYMAYVRGNPCPTNPEEDTDYFIYIGNEETEKNDNIYEAQGYVVGVRFSHPKEDVEVPFLAPYRWYAEVIDNTDGTYIVAPVFDEDAWLMVPFVIKHILIALDFHDEDFAMIILNAMTGSISIYFDAEHAHDRDYFYRKYRTLERYFEKTNVEDDIPLSTSEARPIDSVV